MHVSWLLRYSLDITVKFRHTGHTDIRVNFLKQGDAVPPANGMQSRRLKESPASRGVLSGKPVAAENALTDLTDEGAFILCARCRRVITTTADRIIVNGTHIHTFANPHGIIFEIGCFQTAVGCAYQGPLTGDFSWFDGYEWKIAGCKTCLTHLGWLFASGAGGSFHGLILDRLVEDHPRSPH